LGFFWFFWFFWFFCRLLPSPFFRNERRWYHPLSSLARRGDGLISPSREVLLSSPSREGESILCLCRDMRWGDLPSCRDDGLLPSPLSKGEEMVYAPLLSRTEKTLASPLLRSKGEEIVSSLLFSRRARRWSTPLPFLSKGEEMVSSPLLSRKETRRDETISSPFEKGEGSRPYPRPAK
jgi:hypothetical protein